MTSLVDNALECLVLERNAERQECFELQGCIGSYELERRGLGLNRLRISEVETALFGRVMLKLKLTGGRPLPPTRLSPGATVALLPANSSAAEALNGTLTRMGEDTVSVSLDELPEVSIAEPVTLMLLHNEVPAPAQIETHAHAHISPCTPHPHRTIPRPCGLHPPACFTHNLHASDTTHVCCVTNCRSHIVEPPRRCKCSVRTTCRPPLHRCAGLC